MNTISKWIIIGVGSLVVSCAGDPQQAEEPVQQQEEENQFEDTEVDQAEGGEDYGNENATEPEPLDMGEDADQAPAPMIEEESEQGSGGIISGGVKPQPDSGPMSVDCEETTMAADPGFVVYGCKATLANGQKASRLKGQWRPYSKSGERLRMRDIKFRNSGYDVTFSIRENDAANGFEMKRQ